MSCWIAVYCIMILTDLRLLFESGWTWESSIVAIDPWLPVCGREAVIAQPERGELDESAIETARRGEKRTKFYLVN